MRSDALIANEWNALDWNLPQYDNKEMCYIVTKHFELLDGGEKRLIGDANCLGKIEMRELIL
jgi:hypothetical protein